MGNLLQIVIILLLIILLSLIIRYIQNNNSLELFSNTVSNYDKKKYLANISEEHIEFILLNLKLGINKYLTVIQHQPFHYDNKHFKPIGQLSIITDKEIPQKSTFFTEAIKNNESAHLCASFNSKPKDYEYVWDSSMMYESTTTPFSIWRPKPEPGFVALSDIIVRGMQKPSVDIMTCVPINHTIKLNNVNSLLWRDNGISCKSVGRSFKRCINDDIKHELYDLIKDYNGMFTDDEKKIVISAISK